MPELVKTRMIDGETNDDGGTKLVNKRKISAKFALANLIKGLLGAGCFSLPMAFKQSGWLAALVIIAVLAVLSVLCMIKIIQCADFVAKLNSSGPLDYGQMAEQATENTWKPLRGLASAARTAVNASVVLLQLGICCVFYIFVVYHTHEILEVLLPKDEIPSRATLFPLLLPAFIVLGAVSSLRALSFVSLTGNILMSVAISVILFQLLAVEHKGLSELQAVTDFSGVVASAGAVLYALAVQALVLPLENRMKQPEKMKGPFGVLSTGVASVSIIYAVVGFLGYSAFGQNVEDTITLNLPNDVLGIFLKVVLLLAVFSGFLIQVFPVVVLIWPPFKNSLRQRDFSPKQLRAAHTALRVALVLLVFGAAMLIPRLEDMIPLIGVTSGMLLSFVFPALFHFLLFAPLFSQSSSKCSDLFALVVDVVCFALGVFFVVVGFWTNLQHILHA